MQELRGGGAREEREIYIKLLADYNEEQKMKQQQKSFNQGIEF